jgi:hypothetical protein
MCRHCSNLWFRLDVLSTLQVLPPETGVVFCIYYTIEDDISKLELSSTISREPLPSPWNCLGVHDFPFRGVLSLTK